MTIGVTMRQWVGSMRRQRRLPRVDGLMRSNCSTDAGRMRRKAVGLQLRACALYGAGEFEASIAAWEDLHALHVADERSVSGGDGRCQVALFLLIDTGLMAAVRGWLRRSERLLDGYVEEPAHVMIAVVRGYERFMCGDMAGARLTHRWRSTSVPARRVPGPGDRAGVRCSGHDVRGPHRRTTGPARRDRHGPDVRFRRSAHDGNYVLRAGLCRSGHGAPGVRHRVARGDGSIPAWRGDRFREWAMPGSSRRDPPDFGSVRRAET